MVPFRKIRTSDNNSNINYGKPETHAIYLGGTLVPITSLGSAPPYLDKRGLIFERRTSIPPKYMDLMRRFIDTAIEIPPLVRGSAQTHMEIKIFENMTMMSIDSMRELVESEPDLYSEKDIKARYI